MRMTAGNHRLQRRPRANIFEVVSRSRGPAEPYRYPTETMPYELPHPDAAVPKLDPTKVPSSLHSLIHYAELYGISDDSYRQQVLDRLTDVERDKFSVSVAIFDDALDAWLAGPDAMNPTPTHEYIAFSAMWMAADSL